MDKYIHNHAIDQSIVDRIVCEVKSHGIFDEFRRECMADVDTKPAYQNLRHRVEQTVQAFLDKQKWTPDMNKIQLREKLRRDINDKGFLETGVERIVDQVVNPKINSVFLPKVEDLSYKYMGVEKPKERRLKVETNHLGFLPNLDLEQVSPDSSNKSKSPQSQVEADDNMSFDDADDKMEDFESPAFEPLESFRSDDVKEDSCIDMDIAVSEDMEYEAQNNNAAEEVHNENSLNDDAKSNLSSISGLTSNESTNCMDDTKPIELIVKEEIKEEPEEVTENYAEAPEIHVKVEEEQKENSEYDDMSSNQTVQPLQGDQEISADSESKIEPKKEIHSVITDNLKQDSALSLISSNSQISTVVNCNTNQDMPGADEGQNDGLADASSNIEATKTQVEDSIRDMSLCDISEEAQMQKFNDSSSSENSATDKNEVKVDDKAKTVTNFDISKDEIKFEGTERHPLREAIEEEMHKPSNDIEPSTPTDIERPKFEPSSFHIRPNHVSCSDLNVEDVRTSLSDVFDTNSSQSHSNNLVIVETNDDDASVNKSRDFSQSRNISPLTQESNPATEKDLSIERNPSIEESEVSIEKGLSQESSCSKDKNDRKVANSSNRSSSNQNGKERSKDRERSSTSIKDRSSSSSSYNKDKYRKSSTSHSSTRHRSERDKNKNSSHESSSKKHESSTCTSKDKSTDSRKTSSEKDSSSHYKSSKRDKDHSSSRASDSDRSREKSSSSHRNKSTSSSSTHRSHHSDKRNNDDKKDDRHRTDSKKSTSKKDDDHTSYKSKPFSRQRSRSKDSNDGSSYPGSGFTKLAIELKQPTQKTEEDKGSNGTTPSIPVNSLAMASGSAVEFITTPVDHGSTGLGFSQAEHVDTNASTLTSTELSQSMEEMEVRIEKKTDEDFILPAKPVVVDHVLSGTELNLELFMDGQQQNLTDPVISQIEEALRMKNQIRKPKVAENIFEARKLMKVRKQIERQEQKKLEQARVLAKQFIRDNITTVSNDTQGVEIEFSCHGSAETGFKMNGPIISSPAIFAEVQNISPEPMVAGSSDSSKIQASPNRELKKEEVGENEIEVCDDQEMELAYETASESEGFSIVEIENEGETQETTVADQTAIIERQIEAVADEPVIAPETQGKTMESMDAILTGDDGDFHGFTESDLKNSEAQWKIPSIDKIIQTISCAERHRALFIENNQLAKSTKIAKSSTNNNKRRHIENHIHAIPSKISRSNALGAWTDDVRNDNKTNLINYNMENPDLFLAKVIISKTDSSAHGKLKSSNTNELNADDLMGTARANAKQKTRYTNDELFKPRPVIGGSRSRRRGVNNCDE